MDYMDLAVRYLRKAVKLNHSFTPVLPTASPKNKLSVIWIFLNITCITNKTPKLVAKILATKFCTWLLKRKSILYANA